MGLLVLFVVGDGCYYQDEYQYWCDGFQCGNEDFVDEVDFECGGWEEVGEQQVGDQVDDDLVYQVGMCQQMKQGMFRVCYVDFYFYRCVEGWFRQFLC